LEIKFSKAQRRFIIKIIMAIKCFKDVWIVQYQLKESKFKQQAI